MKPNNETDPLDDIQKNIEKHAAILGERCESVIIIVTAQDGGRLRPRASFFGVSNAFSDGFSR